MTAVLARLATMLLVLGMTAAFGSAALAQADDCKHRGQLDTLYCDENDDLVADAPKDPKKWRDPSALVFAYTPVEDPAVYENVFKPFTEYLAQCTGKRVVYYPVQLELRRDRGDALGPPARRRLLDRADRVRRQHGRRGAVRHQGHRKGLQGYHLISLVKASSPYQKLADLKGKRVAHTAPSSNSGNLAPLVLFPPEGLKPDDDYKPLMSGGHDKSALGVRSGDYDMARRRLRRVRAHGDRAARSRPTTSASSTRAELFPTSSFAYAHDLKPELAKKLNDCFYAFRFPPEMQKEFNGDDRFFPITYKDAWAVVREIAEESGTPYNKAAYDAGSQARGRSARQEGAAGSERSNRSAWTRPSRSSRSRQPDSVDRSLVHP